MKFKLGDKVKLVKLDDEVIGYSERLNKTGKITSEDNDEITCLTWDDGKRFPYMPYTKNLELVQENTSRPEQIQTLKTAIKKHEDSITAIKKHEDSITAIKKQINDIETKKESMKKLKNVCNEVQKYIQHNFDKDVTITITKNDITIER